MSDLQTKEAQRRLGRGRIPPSAADRKEFSTIICGLLVGAQEIQQAPMIAIFHPREHEVDLTPLWRIFPKRIVFPRVTGSGLEFARVEKWGDLRAGFKGIFEPTGPAETLPSEAIVLTPGLAFDRKGGRLGSGQGYYDRFLEGKSYRAWGICFESQVSQEPLAQTPTDARMSALVTEKGVCRIA